MAELPGILELYVNGKMVESFKIFTQTNIANNIKSLKEAYLLDDKYNYEFWLVYKSKMNNSG